MRRLVLAALLLASLEAGADCQPTTRALDGMARAEVSLRGPGGRVETLDVRVADDYRERAAGFQHVCPETIEATAIYFEFERPRRPNFHMRNVKAPLDIAFIDADGVIADIQTMQPYVLGARQHRTWGPPREVTAALEAKAGYFSGLQISAGDWTVELVQR
ncbi:MAG TPA: DUF192 domain-containing protein [Arenicellales bacterium]|nr:DUF192 domain-containing protein [Arenicellales bacterium]